MKLKFEISPDLAFKFESMLAKEFGENVWGVEIKDCHNQYQFSFRMIGSGWTIELDKNPNGAWYTLHCSSQELYLPIDIIKDLKLFCQQIARIRQMQSDYIDNKKR